ncbi:protein kinase domain-containing protein [Streptomyces mashuensis]|uniref:protein kinase domain-containing protein n=1 Tax=Streptomyces mashuensis TaxID=33904 RepID=UPI00167E6321|nr:protein kinase [Streptomyces mashuensis]
MIEPLLPTDPSGVGPYVLVARLGGGGMGKVYLGRSPGGLTVAVKVVRAGLAEDERFRRRFALEVEAARRVGGFYTAQVVDADTEADPPWLVTSYIPGLSLKEAVEQRGPLPLETVAALGAGLAEGLAAIHVRNLVHRDLKPGNVILAEDGPRVIDFGIARALDSTSQLTHTGGVIGTPAFMSPEQIQGREATPAGDVFCLGSVLAYAATGRPPFGEGPSEAVVYRVVHGEPDLTTLPRGLLPLVRACLAKDPAARPGVTAILDHCAGPRGTSAWRLPVEVRAVITRQTAETRAIITEAGPSTASGPAAGAPRAVQPLRARPLDTGGGYTHLSLPWLPGETGGARRTTVVCWHRKVGDTVDKGEPLLSVSSARGDVVITSPRKGILFAIHRREGATARTGTVVAGIGQEGAAVRRPPLSRRVRVTLASSVCLLLTAAVMTAVWAWPLH